MKIAEKSQTGLEEMETRPKLGELKETLIRDQNYAKLVVDKHREAQLLTTARVPGVGKWCKRPNCYCVTRMQITPSYARNSRRAGHSNRESREPFASELKKSQTL